MVHGPIDTGLRYLYADIELLANNSYSNKL